jgi:hypothetical protein
VAESNLKSVKVDKERLINKRSNNTVPLRSLRAMDSCNSSGSGGGDTVSLLLRSGDHGERSPGLSNLFTELV